MFLDRLPLSSKAMQQAVLVSGPVWDRCAKALYLEWCAFHATGDAVPFEDLPLHRKEYFVALSMAVVGQVLYESNKQVVG